MQAVAAPDLRVRAALAVGPEGGATPAPAAETAAGPARRSGFVRAWAAVAGRCRRTPGGRPGTWRGAALPRAAVAGDRVGRELVRGPRGRGLPASAAPRRAGSP